MLIAKVPPAPQPEGHQLREGPLAAGAPIFNSDIPFLVAYKKASAEGITAKEVPGDASARRAWLAYERIGRKIFHD